MTGKSTDNDPRGNLAGEGLAGETVRSRLMFRMRWLGNVLHEGTPTFEAMASVCR